MLFRSHAALSGSHCPLPVLIAPEATGRPDGQDIVVVEWPDRLGCQTPAGALSLTFSLSGGEERDLRIEGWPDRLADR